MATNATVLPPSKTSKSSAKKIAVPTGLIGDPKPAPGNLAVLTAMRPINPAATGILTRRRT